MSALHLLDHFEDAGVTLYKDGDALKAKPASKLNDVLREVIRENKAALLEALSVTSTYWLIGDATFVTYAPPATLQTVRADYPGQLVAPLTYDQWALDTVSGGYL
jgi:TubC N-terminal docking domain